MLIKLYGFLLPIVFLGMGNSRGEIYGLHQSSEKEEEEDQSEVQCYKINAKEERRGFWPQGLLLSWLSTFI